MAVDRDSRGGRDHHVAADCPLAALRLEGSATPAMAPAAAGQLLGPEPVDVLLQLGGNSLFRTVGFLGPETLGRLPSVAPTIRRNLREAKPHLDLSCLPALRSTGGVRVVSLQETRLIFQAGCFRVRGLRIRPATGRELRELQEANASMGDQLRVLNLTGCPLDEEALEPMARCAGLQKLILTDCIRLIGVSGLRGCVSLETLNLARCIIEDRLGHSRLSWAPKAFAPRVHQPREPPGHAQRLGIQSRRRRP